MNRRSLPRPVFFDLTRIQMPVGALTSITHRATGIVLALGIPFGFYALHLSHHMLAGERHLLMNIGVGSHLATARRIAWVVNVGVVAIALLARG